MNLPLTAVAASMLLAGPAAAPPPAPASAPARPPAPLTFGSEVELVKVDAVVVDKQGNPVLGLRREDFTLAEEDVPQTIASFEAVPPPPPTPAVPPRRPFISTNLSRSTQPGRIFAILFDDMHMSPQQAYRAKLAVAEFLDSGVHTGDDVMLVPSSGGGWWSGRMPFARDELIGVLKRYEGRQLGSTVSQDTMTDYEAMMITTRQDANAIGVVTRRFESAGLSAQLARDKDDPTPRMVNSYLDERAREAYNQALARDRVALGTLTRLLDALAAGKGRKSIILVSRGFILNGEVSSEFRQTVDAARRANTAIYFLDTRGLTNTLSRFDAEFGGGAGITADPLLLYADMTVEAEGSDALASETGGFAVHHSKELAAGINRIAKESRGYYLLGYSPKETFEDGRFRRISVRVNRKGVTVRARRGYFAPSPGLVVKKERAEDEPDPQMQQALDAPFDADSVPLRLTAYTAGETLIDRAKVHVAADIDIRDLAYERKNDRLVDALDVLLLVSQRETGEVFQYSERVEMNLRPQTLKKTPWFPMLHEFDLGTGSYQARLVVRDENNKKLGSVLHSFDLPDLGSFRVSTPVLSDTLTPESKGTDNPQPLPLARRTFYARGPLYVHFEVYNAARDAATGKPNVICGHRMVASDGRVVAESQPSAIAVPSSGTVARLLSFPLDGVAPGEYDMVVTVADGVANKSLELREAFTVEPAAAAPAQ